MSHRQPAVAARVLALAVLLGALLSGGLWWLLQWFNNLNFIVIVLPLLVLNLGGVMAAGCFHLLSRRRSRYYRLWYGRAMAVGIANALLVLALDIFLGPYGQYDSVQVAAWTLGTPVFYWLAMSSSRDDVPWRYAALAVSTIGLLQVCIGVVALVHARQQLYVDTLWNFRSDTQLLLNALLLVFFHPVYIGLPLALSGLGLFELPPRRLRRKASLPVAVD